MAFKMCGRALAFSIGAMVGLAPAVYAQESDVAAEKKPATFDDFLARLPDQPAPSLDDTAASVEEPAEEDTGGRTTKCMKRTSRRTAARSRRQLRTMGRQAMNTSRRTSIVSPRGRTTRTTSPTPNPRKRNQRPPVNRVLVAGAAGLAAAAGVLPTLVLSLLIPVPFLSTIAAVVVNLLTRDFEASRAVAISGLVGFALGAVLAVVAGRRRRRVRGQSQLEIPASFVPVYGFLSKGFVAALGSWAGHS